MSDILHPLKHGTRYAFETWGCPCAVCREAHERWVVARRMRRLRERLLGARTDGGSP